MVRAGYFDEITLLKELRDSSSEAFIQLYDHYHPALHAYILRFVKIPAIAEDVLQDVFLKIWEVRQRIDPGLSFNAYLYRISRNMVFKLMKKIAADDELRLKIMRQLSNSAEEGHLKLQWKQYEEILTAAINQLPPKRLQVFKLCRDQGKTYDEAAEELGISKNTVKEHMVAAMKSIKDYLSRNGDILRCLFFLVM